MSEHDSSPQQPPTPDPGGSRGAGGPDHDRDPGGFSRVEPDREHGEHPAPPGPPPGPAAGVPVRSGQSPSGPSAGPPAPPSGQDPLPGTEPVGGQSGWRSPAGTQPGWGAAGGTQAGWEQPTGSQPGWEQPTSAQPGWEQPTGPQPGYDQLAWGAPPPDARPGGRGHAARNALAVVGVLALMAISAVGGGVAGALVYAQSDNDAPGAEATRVVDAPQLDYTSLASIASSVSDSVVSIQVGQASGSGVVMSEDGYIITNAHVVQAGTGDQVAVRFSNGEVAQATVIGADARSDIAVIQVEGVAGLTPAEFGSSSDVLVGDTVLAIGSPLGFEGSVTQGIISALDRTLNPGDPEASPLSGLLQTDAAINRGNSGGALVNLDGQVIGINTAIAVENQNGGFLGVGFAVPSDRATDVAQQLIDGEEVQHPLLGVRVATAEDGGALVGEVSPGSAADDAGLQQGDVIVRFGDRAISDSNDLVSAVQSAEVGQTVEVEFQRDGQTQTTDVTLNDAED